MARKSDKGPAKPNVAGRKAAKDVISQSVEASAAKVADLGDAVQRSAVPSDAARHDAPVKAAPAKTVRTPPPPRMAAPAAVEQEPVAVEPALSEPEPEPAASAEAIVLAEEFEPPTSAASVEPVAVSERPAPTSAETSTSSSKESAAQAAEEGDPVQVHQAGEPLAAAVPEPPSDVSAAPSIEKPPIETPPITALESVAAAVCANRSLRESMEVAADGLTALNRKTIEAFRTNAGMTFDLFRSLIGVTSLAEAVQIHTEHARHQFEVISAQARELQALARQMALGGGSPPA